MSENNAFLRAFYILVHLFAVTCKTTASSDQIIGFVENMKMQQFILNSLLKLGSSPYIFSFRTIQLNQTN